jgi:hypothetical protein
MSKLQNSMRLNGNQTEYFALERIDLNNFYY